MFSFKSKGKLFAPADGKSVPLSALPDPAFAEGMLGDGIAVDPTDGCFVSPCNGVVAGVADTRHAYNLVSDDGLELLLHIGIDTVQLKGAGFSSKVKEGDRVRVGDLLAEVDLDKLRRGGYSLLTPLLIVNSDVLSSLVKEQGIVKRGKDTVLRYEIRK